MIRREFVTLLGGAASWPFAARAQQADRVRRIGYLSATDAPGEPQAASRRLIMEAALARLGYVEVAISLSIVACSAIRSSG